MSKNNKVNRIDTRKWKNCSWVNDTSTFRLNWTLLMMIFSSLILTDVEKDSR